MSVPRTKRDNAVSSVSPTTSNNINTRGQHHRETSASIHTALERRSEGDSPEPSTGGHICGATPFARACVDTTNLRSVLAAWSTWRAAYECAAFLFQVGGWGTQDISCSSIANATCMKNTEPGLKTVNSCTLTKDPNFSAT